MKILSVEDLIEAYVHNNLNLKTDKLILENDQVTVHKDDECVFKIHPYNLLRMLLDDAGLPWEDA